MQATRELILNGRPTIGSWLQLADPALTEMMARAGFDWLAIDMEHTTTSVESMGRMVRIADLAGIPVLVRLSSHSPTLIKRALDAGARGIIAPMVNTAAEAEAIVAASYYPPRGSRGVGLARAQGYGLEFATYRDGGAADLVVIAQVEHIDGVQNLAEILAVDGIDGFFVGPYDLSGSLGHPGEFDHPDVQAALEEVSRHISASGKVAGIHVVEPDTAKLQEALEAGYRLVGLASEMLILAHQLSRLESEIESLR